MIRPATPDDKKAIMAIAVAISLFSQQELEELGAMLAEYFDGHLGSDHFWITYEESEPVGVAYYAPEPFTWGMELILYCRSSRPSGRRTRWETATLCRTNVNGTR